MTNPENSSDVAASFEPGKTELATILDKLLHSLEVPEPVKWFALDLIQLSGIRSPNNDLPENLLFMKTFPYVIDKAIYLTWTRQADSKWIELLFNLAMKISEAMISDPYSNARKTLSKYREMELAISARKSLI